MIRSFYFSHFITILFYFIPLLISHSIDRVLSVSIVNETIPSIIVFGDSIVDPGNNDLLVTPAKCNYPPYGQDFPGGQPTGRFSNGLIPTDLLAQEFGIKEFLPAFLDPNLEIEDLLTGVSFASGAAGYDPLTTELTVTLSLPNQLDMFKRYLNKINSTFGQEKLNILLCKGLFVMCFGSNDISNTYFTLRSAHYDFDSYTDLLANSASNFVQQLYEVGARRIGLMGVPPIGCVPSQRTSRGGLSRDCAEEENQLALLFNSKISLQLDSLTKKLPNAKFLYIDIYNPLLSLIQNPSQYGFEEAKRGCCGTGYIEVTFLCNKFTAKTCPDVSKYIFWDSFHPTEKAYRVLVHSIVEQTKKYFF